MDAGHLGLESEAYECAANGMNNGHLKNETGATRALKGTFGQLMMRTQAAKPLTDGHITNLIFLIYACQVSVRQAASKTSIFIANLYHS